MSKDVFQCFKEIVEKTMGKLMLFLILCSDKTSPDAVTYLAELKGKDRYIEDVWS